MQNATFGAFCNTFDLHLAIVGLEKNFLVFFRVALLHRFYCTCISVPEDCYKGAVVYLPIQLSSGVNFNLSLPLHPYFVCVSGGDSGKIEHLCSVDSLHISYLNKYQNLINCIGESFQD